MKKVLVFIALFALIIIPFQKSEAAAKPAYDYDLVYQSPYPATMSPGQTTNVWIEVKNTGTNTWWDYQDPAYPFHPVRLGTGSQYGTLNQQRDYPSEFAAGNWLSSNRATNIDPIVIKPGWNTRFQFDIQAPTTPGTYKAYFTPVVDGITWMKDMGIYWEITVSGTSQTVPIVPLNLNVSQCTTTTSALCISWGTVVNGLSNNYELYRSTNASSGFSRIYSGNLGLYQDSDIVTGTTYYYKVRSSFDNQNYSDYTSVVSATANSSSNQSQIPATPEGLSVQYGAPLGTVASSSDISWNSSVGATSYELHRDTSYYGSYATIVYSGSNTKFTDTGLSSGVRYYYKVLAKNTMGSSQLSTFPAEVFITSGTAPVLTAPNALTVIARNDGSFYLSWDAPLNVNVYGYTIRVSDTSVFDPNSDHSIGGFTETNVTIDKATMTDIGINPVSGNTYYFKLDYMVATASDSSGYATSPDSSIVSAVEK